MSTEDLPGDNRKDEQDQGEARVEQLITKTLKRYERLLRRLAKE